MSISSPLPNVVVIYLIWEHHETLVNGEVPCLISDISIINLTIPIFETRARTLISHFW